MGERVTRGGIGLLERDAEEDVRGVEDDDVVGES